MTVNLLFVGRTRQITQDTASGMHVSLVSLRARPFVCRKVSPALARLYFLALGGLHFVKTIINRFILVHPVRGARKKPNAIALGFFQRCVPQAERDVSFESEVRFAR